MFIVKIFSFVLVALAATWLLLTGCSSDVEAFKTIVIQSDKIYTIGEDDESWYPDENIQVFVKSMENKPLHEGEVGVELYYDVGHKAKGYGTRAHLFSDDTVDEAEEIMLVNLLEANEYIDHLVSYPLNKHQRNALVSLVYNIGPTKFKNSVALKHLNNGHINLFLIEAFDKRRGFTCADGKYNKGLIERRALEREIWLKGDYKIIMDA